MDLKYKLTLLSCFLLMGSSLFAGDREEKIEKEFNLGKKGTITIDANDGVINISTWNKNIVRVKVVKKVYGYSSDRVERALDDVHIRMDLRGNTLSIRVLERNHNRFRYFNSRRERVRVYFDITAPKEVSLEIVVDESDVSVNGTKGDLEISTDEGDIDLRSIEANRILLEADEGRIFLENVKINDDGDELIAKIEVDEGSIKISDAEFSSLDLRADEGEIKIKNTKVKDLVARVDEGSISIELDPSKDSEIRVESDEGNVELRFPKDYSVEYDLYASDGSIRSDFDIDFYDSDYRNDYARARGTLRNGDNKLRVKTDEGNIRFMRK